MKLSIEVTAEQHLCLKAAAALEGKTLKAYVLERALAEIPGTDHAKLEDILRARLQKARGGSISGKSVNDIFDEEIRESDSGFPVR